MTAQASYYLEGLSLDYTPAAAVTGGDVTQLADGRAAVIPTDVAAGSLGAARVAGVFKVQKTADINILDGGRVFWDYSANKAHFKAVNDRDFYMGVAVGDSPDTQTYVYVALNIEPRYLLDLARDPYISVIAGTAAFNGLGFPYREGGALRFALTSTNEAQKVDALSVAGFSPDANAIAEMAFRMPNGGSGSASDFTIGIASGTHATDFESVAEFAAIHLDGGATAINAESDDGTTDVAPTDTTKVFSAGTALSKRVECWIDTRDKANVKFYVDGVRVLTGTTFTLAAATGPLFLIAHLEKTTGTETADMTIDWLRARIAEQ